MLLTIGSRIKDWIILSELLNRPSHTTGYNELYYRCECVCCNQIFEVTRCNILKTNSCFRCWNCRFRYTSRKTHGEAYNRTRLYTIWANMRNRCLRRTNKNFHNYGGKGIFVSEVWKSYADFKVWALSSGYRDSLTIDRIDSTKGYYPENCRWISQALNSKLRARSLIRSDGKKFESAEQAALTMHCHPQSIRLAARSGTTVCGYHIRYE